MKTDGKVLPETRSQRVIDMTERDFLYQRRLVSLRPFVTNDGVPGFNLRFEGDEMIAMRIESPLLDIFHRAISRLKESPRIKR